jgi:hypothetical protein
MLRAMPRFVFASGLAAALCFHGQPVRGYTLAVAHLATKCRYMPAC